MNAKRKPASPKENWQRTRRRYRWHLRPPFKTQFDRSHWWKNSPNNEPGAALYELARRHPLVRETWLKNFEANSRSPWNIARKNWKSKITMPLSGSELPLINCLDWTCFYGMKSWANLTSHEQDSWKFHAGKMKGLDLRWDFHKCESVSSHEALLDVVGKLRGTNPLTASQREADIAQWAVEAHRQGKVLLVVAPDLTPEKAASVMVKTYQEHLRHCAPAKPTPRARWQDWLLLIETFENDENSPGKAKSQVFARYRRALDGLSFT
jgi:hypothetical protein